MLSVGHDHMIERRERSLWQQKNENIVIGHEESQSSRSQQVMSPDGQAWALRSSMGAIISYGDTK